MVEAVFENMELKKAVFAEIDKVAKPGAVLASNTSTLNHRRNRWRLDLTPAGWSSAIHFFSPANVMKLLEIVRGKQSTQEVLATVDGTRAAARKSRRAGRQLLGIRRQSHVRSLHARSGFFSSKRVRKVQEGSTRCSTEWGMAMGPLAVGDLAGLDVGWRIRKEYRHLEKPGVRQPFAEDNLCEQGRFGQKTGAGWYKYDENRRAVNDHEVAALIKKWVGAAGTPQRQITAEEITDRCLYALVNEGARILEEGYALRASDIDIIYLNGYGFPAHRGGPMWYADTVGLKKVLARIEEFHRQHGELWEPAPLLKRLAAENKTFADWGKTETAAAR